MLKINAAKCDLCGICKDVCPFGAIDIKKDKVEIGDGCRLCSACIKKCPKGAIEKAEEEEKEEPRINKDEWEGILVIAECTGGKAHGVTFELLGEARKLSNVTGHNVICAAIGCGILETAEEIAHFGADRVIAIDSPELSKFRADIYTNVLEELIKEIKPSTVLIGATAQGRSLAPNIACRFKTGLTADCTSLEMKENTDLVQIRPAFGGNIMARILTTNTRPQFATVRYKVMDKAKRTDEKSCKVETFSPSKGALHSGIEILSSSFSKEELSISDAEIIVVGGRGVKNAKDYEMIKELATLLGGQYAGTRPMIEAGIVHYKRQIGLSGRTVRPKLIITCGVSGAIQFTAAMNASEYIIAINKDPDAPIMKIANMAVVGDIYEIIPKMIDRIKRGVS